MFGDCQFGVQTVWRETTMDFIEQLFGFSPDAGNGSFELLCFAALTLVVYAIGLWRQRRPVATRR
jgi:hypothetical protein